MIRLLTYSLLLVLAFSDAAFSQRVFHFDYYTIYDYRKSEQDSVSARTVVYSNSINPEYFLHFNIVNNELAEHVKLTDFENRTVFEFPKAKTIGDLKNKSFEDFYGHRLSTKNWDESKKVYAVNYQNNATGNTIEINLYKNQKKRKLIETLYLETVPTTITKKQKFNFGLLTFPLLTQKLDLKEDGLIAKAYGLTDGKKTDIRSLVEIKETDFTITMTTNK